MKGYRLNIGPASFTEGDGILRETSLSGFGGTALLVGEEFILKKFRGELKRTLKSVRIANGGFAGECSENEIKRLCALGKNKKADFVTGIGGGKALDTAKAAAGRLKLPVVTIPTSAATCAAWTALSAVYTDEGSSRTYILLDRCPDLLILDTGIIASCPARYLRSGMADALAKFYEAMAFTGGSSPGRGIEAALGIARSIYDTVFESGMDAARDNEKTKLSAPLLKIMETNIMMAGLVGGLGGEGCRASVAHALCNGFTQAVETRPCLHGEIVGFCSIVQLVLEKKFEEAGKLARFYKKLQLPYRLAHIGAKPSLLGRVIGYAFSPHETMRNFPVKVTKNMVEKAILELEGMKI